MSYELSRFLSHLQGSGHEDVKEERRREKAGEWHYVPYGIEDFVGAFKEACEMFTDLHGMDPQSFLEVGCGKAWITLYVQSAMYGKDKAFGLENHKPYVDFSRLLCGDKAIIQGDALRFKRYGDYDLIYFYMPFRDVKKQKKLVDLITSQAKGIVFCPAYGVDHTQLTVKGTRRHMPIKYWSGKLGKPIATATTVLEPEAA